MISEKFLTRMQDMLGEEYEEFLAALRMENHQALRVNTLKTSVLSFLEKAPFTLEGVPWEETGFYYKAPDQPGRHPYHEAGVYYIQEPSAMAPAGLLEAQPEERVLDLCAAPGGKSTQIAASMKGRGILVCNEIHPARAKILSENVERMGISNALVTNETPERLAEAFPEYFDRILVDAPCSGEGMFRKNEEACREWSPENVELCARRQDRILDCAAGMLRPGGRLVYSTCTFAPLENEGTVFRFLERHPEFEVLEAEKKGGMSDGVPEWTYGTGTKRQRTERQGTEGQSAEGQRTERQGTEEQRAEGQRTEGQETGSEAARCVRLWPHRLKGEGHFAAILSKRGGPGPSYKVMPANGIQAGIPLKELREFREFRQEFLRTDRQDFSRADQEGIYLRFGEQLYLAPPDMPSVKGLKVLRPGLHLGSVKKNRMEPSHALALALQPKEAVYSLHLSSRESLISQYLSGATFPAQGEKGWYLITVDGYGLGWGKLAGGIMKNHYPKGLRKI